MAEIPPVTCPECEKRFKPKTDVRGKKIKCPFCKSPIAVPAEAAEKKNGKAKKSEAVKAAKPQSAGKKGQPPTVTAAAPNPPPTDDDDGNPDPYGVKNVELVPRCPNCTEEMGPHDIICLACGYNTMTRTWGKTEKTVGLTFGRHLVYLLPALGAAAFVVFSVLFLIFSGTAAPHLLYNTMFEFLDSESMRMWGTVVVLVWIFGGGIFCMKRFIEKPKPDEIQLD